MIHQKIQSLDGGVSSWIHNNCVIVCDMVWLIPNFISIKIFFISHNIRRCHTSSVLNHPADLSGMDLTSEPSWFTHSPGKPARRYIVPKFLKDHCYFLYPLPTKLNKYCVSSVLIPNDCQCSSKQLYFKMMIIMYPTMLTILLHMCRVNPSSDSDKVKVTVTCSHYHIRAADAGLLKIDRCWASSPVLDNKLFIFV